MAKTKISEFSTTAGNNTDINSINIAEGCAPSGINDAIRELMRQLKEFQTGGAGDSVNSGGDFSVATNKFTVASASGNTSVAGTLGVTGTTTLTGALVANGNATLGDASGDTVTIKGTPTLEVNPTLSGGTANGVLYLNGSKVATSGSALTFDGTNFFGGTNTYVTGRFYAQRSSSSLNLAIAGYTDGSAGAVLTGNKGDIVAFGNAGGDGVIFANANTEQMRLTSSSLYTASGISVGIGTSSPSYKLDVNGNAQVGNATAATNRSLFINGVVNKASRIVFQESGADRWLIGNGAASENGNFEIYDAVNGNNLIFNHSGNLGLGVTPSAWGGTFKALQVGTASLYRNAGTDTFVGANFYFDGSSNKYISSAPAAAYGQVSGAHQFFTAASGTEGNAITFTQALTLDASGNLLLGTTSILNSGKLSVYQTNNSFGVVVQNTASSVAGAYGIQANLTQDPNTTDSFFYKGTGNATDRFYVRANGGIGNYQANDVNLSDRREKTDFAPAKSYLDTICSIPVQTFKYIDQTDAEKTLGVVAQDVQAVAPELVSESNWGTKEEPKMRLSIYQTDLQYALMKALQELKAEFDAYKAAHP